MLHIYQNSVNRVFLQPHDRPLEQHLHYQDV